MKGYFKAPETGRYRFLMACDDSCTLKMSINDSRNPATMETILYRSSWTRFRNGIYTTDKTEGGTNEGVIYSKWLDLNQDQYYYFETTVRNSGGGPIHLTIGMELELETMPASHPHMETQIQKFSF